MLSPEILFFAPVIVLGAYVTFAITGFGSTLIAVPLLAHLFPLQFVIPVVLLLDGVACMRQGLRLREDIFQQELVPMLPFLLVGMAAGAILLIRVSGEVLLPLLGVFVTGFGAYYLLSHDPAFTLRRWWVAPVGLFGGTISSLFGISGPIYVMYLVGRGATPDQIRATMPVLFIFTVLTRVVLFGFGGLITIEVLLTAALLAPVMFLGLHLGNRLHVSIPRATIARLIGALLLASGVSLLLRSL
ncbi:MAG: sulfite exporter TauE/SafE family protein [Betaproteobacteria bacterium]|nr:sulfite exporter TauE/SafE family protein [Betaproteobacteria bacterium]